MTSTADVRSRDLKSLAVYVIGKQPSHRGENRLSLQWFRSMLALTARKLRVFACEREPVKDVREVTIAANLPRFDGTSNATTAG